MDSLTQHEREEFSKLDDIHVVFDVGARESIDYLKIKPNAIYHLFEPNPQAFEELKRKVEAISESRGMVIINNFGLGDKVEMLPYDRYLQSFGGSEALPNGGGDTLLPIKTLDSYITENNITRVDFLKIDAEGMDYKILQGGVEAIKLARYIQYEHWDNKEKFHELLQASFDMKYIGDRNVFCTRK